MDGEFLLNYSLLLPLQLLCEPERLVTKDLIGGPSDEAPRKALRFITRTFILAFEPSFIEIRRIETEDFSHMIVGKNARMLRSSKQEVDFS